MFKLSRKTTGFILATLVLSSTAALAQGFINRIPPTPMEAQHYLDVEEIIPEETAEVEPKGQAVEEQEIESIEEEAQQEKDAPAEKSPEEATYPGQDQAPEAITGNQYVVQPSDTLSLIAERAGVTAEHLKQVNGIQEDLIMPGQLLIIHPAENLPEKQIDNQPIASRGDRDEDLYWLSRIIHAEAQGESYEGKVAVGNVVLNRVKSSLFPNSVKGVVFDKQQGYTQFSPVLDGSIYNTPGSESVQAAKDALGGSRPVGDALYFLNPSKSTNFWIIKNRQYSTTIGDHDFYY